MIVYTRDSAPPIWWDGELKDGLIALLLRGWGVMKNCPCGTPPGFEGSSENDLVAGGRGVISAGMFGIDLLGMTGVW